MADKTVQVIGLAQIEKNLKQLGEQMRERGVKLMMSRAAVPMRNDAKRRAPVLSTPSTKRLPGTVRDAIKIWRKKGTRWAITYYVGVRGISKAATRKFVQENFGKIKNITGGDNPKDPYYWRFLELGTSKMAARPFLRPAFEAQKMESVRIALQTGRDFVKRISAKFERARRSA